MILPVLVVLHQEQSTPGRVGLHFQSRGSVVDIRRPRLGDPLRRTGINKIRRHDQAKTAP